MGSQTLFSPLLGIFIDGHFLAQTTSIAKKSFLIAVTSIWNLILFGTLENQKEDFTDSLSNILDFKSVCLFVHADVCMYVLPLFLQLCYKM